MMLPLLLTGEEWVIGVLAKRSPEVTLQRWGPTADYLNQAIEGQSFSILPVNFEDMDEFVSMKKVDFILANTGIYVDLAFRYEISPIVTMENEIQGQAFTYFGGVLFTRRSTPIMHISQMKGRKLAAVAETSLGGWVALKRELAALSIKPEKYFDRVDFLGSHDAVVLAVLDGAYDAGVVRTDTLETMAAEGQINLKDFRLVNLPQNTGISREQYFPYLVSTRLYPEWPLSRLAHTPSSLAEEVAMALINMPSESPAARKADIMGWTVPLNYQVMHDTFFELNMGPYTRADKYLIQNILVTYLPWVITVGAIFLILVSMMFYILMLNGRLKRSEEELKNMATHDTLTGLPNRRYFQEFASKALELSRRKRGSMGIFYLDLDNFKEINDRYGHEGGDTILSEAAKRMEKQMRSSDLVARVGGDEFVALIQESDKGYAKAAQRLRDVLSLPIIIRNEEIQIGISIGIALFPDDGEDLDVLINRADGALYKAKEQGKGRYLFHNRPRERS